MSLRPLRPPPLLRPFPPPPHRHYALWNSRTPHALPPHHHPAPHPYLPRFLQPTFLRSLIPHIIWRKPSTHRHGWNPYTFFVWAFLIVGSQSINIIALKHEQREFVRRTRTRVDVLRELVEGIQRGEAVDVEAALGVGKAGEGGEERSWEELLKEIEEEDRTWYAKRMGTSLQQQQQQRQQEEEAEERQAQQQEEERDRAAKVAADHEARSATKRLVRKQVTAEDYLIT